MGIPDCAVALTVTTKTFGVGATIDPGCSVTSGSGSVMGTLNFGTYTGAQSGQITTSFVPNAALSIACTPGKVPSMTISNGANFGTVRNMQRTGGTDRVPYRLYTSSSLAANTEITTQSIAISYTNADNIALSIFAAAQLTALSTAGTYTDQLTVTLSW